MHREVPIIQAPRDDILDQEEQIKQVLPQQDGNPYFSHIAYEKKGELWNLHRQRTRVLLTLFGWWLAQRIVDRNLLIYWCDKQHGEEQV
jgi:hypothetical protein